MMKVLRALGGIVAGMAAVFALVILVELFSDKVHPLPPDSDHSMEVMCAHVAAYPGWVLATVVPMWGATAFSGAWLAGIIGGRVPAAIISMLVISALAFNLSMLPYAPWFKVVMPLAALASLAMGAWVACGKTENPRQHRPGA